MRQLYTRFCSVARYHGYFISSYFWGRSVIVVQFEGSNTYSFNATLEGLTQGIAFLEGVN